MILCEIICGNVQKGVDGVVAAKTLVMVDVQALFIGEDALGVLEDSMSAYDESSLLQWLMK